MTSRSATVLVIFIVAVIAFCFASVFASMTGLISILPNNTESDYMFDNISTTVSEPESYGSTSYTNYDDSSSDDSDVETTTDSQDSSSDDSSHSKDSSDDSSSEDSSDDGSSGGGSGDDSSKKGSKDK